MERLIDLCYGLCQNDRDYRNPEAFVFRSIGDFTQIDALNKMHTVLFKIRVPHQDYGLLFKHPCVLLAGDAKLKKLNLQPLSDSSFYKVCFAPEFDDVFEITYDTCDWNDLQRITRIQLDSVGIRNNGFCNVYSLDLIDSCVIGDLEQISLRITGKDTPLKLNYKHGIFDIYCLIAPRITEQFDAYLKVGE